MACPPITFDFLSPLLIEAACCRISFLREARAPNSEGEPCLDDYAEFEPSENALRAPESGTQADVVPDGISVGDAIQVECTVNVMKWVGGRCRARCTFLLSGGDRIEALEKAVQDWIGGARVVIFGLQESDEGALPIASVMDRGAVVGQGGVFMCNIVPATPIIPAVHAYVGVSFFVMLNGSLEFVAPPLVLPVWDFQSWAAFLSLAAGMVSSMPGACECFSQCDVYAIDRTGGGCSLSAIRGGPSTMSGGNIGVCLGSVSHGGLATLHLPHERVVCFVSGVHLSDPFLSVTLTSVDNGCVFTKPWIFDLTF